MTLDIKAIKSYVSEHKGAVKQLSDDRVGGLLVAWGGPNDKDLDGDYFTRETNFELDWYNKRPCLYDHTTDSEIKTTAIGYIDKIEILDELGLWAEAQIRKSRYYNEYIRYWIEEGHIGWSSGSIPQAVQISSDGHIRSWPIVEGSLTRTPAQPLKTTVMPIKHAGTTEVLSAAVKSVGIKDFKVSHFVVDFNKSDEDKQIEAHEREYVEGFDLNDMEWQKAIQVPSDRPVYINLNLFDYLENSKKEKIMPEEITPGTEEINGKNPVSPIPTPDSGKNVTPEPDKATPTKTVPKTAPVPAAQPEGVALDYFKNQVIERAFAKEATVSDEQVESFANQLKQYVCRKTYKSNPTEEQAGYARYDSDYQKLLNELIDSTKTPEVPQKENDTPEEMAEIKAKLAMFEAIIGKGGVNPLMAADGQVEGVVSSNQWGGGFSVDAVLKNKYANHDPRDLMEYTKMREYANKQHAIHNFNTHKRLYGEEQDILYNTIHDQTKEWRENSRFRALMANLDWEIEDKPNEDIKAFKMFDVMDSKKGKWFKADEINNEALEGGGLEWLWTAPDAMLWYTLLEEHDFLNAFASFMMTAPKVDNYIDDEIGMPSIVDPVHDMTDDPATNQVKIQGLYPSQSLGTQKMTWEARHIGEQVHFNRILLEDGRVDIAAAARRAIEESVERGMVWSILNADMMQDGNTNNYGYYGSVATRPALKAAVGHDLAVQGFQGAFGRALHPAGSLTGDGKTKSSTLATKELAGLRAGTTNCVDLMRRTYRMLNERYYGDPSRLLCVMRPSRQNKLYDLEEFKAAISNVGQWDGGNKIMSFDGIPIRTTEQVVARDGEGRIHSNSSNNEFDSILFLRPDKMKIGIRRPMSTLMRIDGAWNEHFHYGKSLRWDFQIIPSAKQRTGADAPTGTIRKPVAALYGLTDTSDN